MLELFDNNVFELLFWLVYFEVELILLLKFIKVVFVVFVNKMIDVINVVLKNNFI